jgi:hypothetical protein
MSQRAQRESGGDARDADVARLARRLVWDALLDGETERAGEPGQGRRLRGCYHRNN